MKIQEQYIELGKLKKKINLVLAEEDLQSNLRLATQLHGNRIYEKLVAKDSQLYMLNHFFCIALREQSELAHRGIQGNVFEGVSSLDVLEEKYLAVEFSVLRMELDLNNDELEETISKIIELQVSGIALFRIIQFETAHVLKNVKRISMELKNRGDGIGTIILLREAVETYPEEGELWLLLANVWMELGEFSEALKCLKEIENPSSEIRSLMEKMEGML